MDGFIEGFWNRFHKRFFLAAGTLVFVTMTLGVAIPVYVLAEILGQSRSGLLREIITSQLSIVLVVAVAMASMPKHRRPIAAWISGDHADPEAARDAALVFAERLSMRGVLWVAPFWLPATLWSFGNALGVHGIGYVGIAAVAIYIFAVGGFIVGTGSRLLLRPLLEEVDAVIPPEHAPRERMWSLRVRVLAAVTASSLTTGIGAVGASYRWGHDINSVVVAGYLGALLMAVYSASLVLIGVLQPTLQPLGDLTGATRRIREGDFSKSVPVTSSDELGDLIQSFNEMTVGLRQREALHAAFGSYVDPALAHRLLSQESSVFAGEAVEVSVFFADVRGFTHYASSVEPEEAMAQLNRLFEILVPAIRDAGGHPNRYTGDGVLAVFGTPEPLLDHANAAVTAALTIQAGVRRTFGESMRLGIGINTGKVVAGTIGAAGKLDFTVIGDVVNVAARVEEHTKQTGDSILLTQATYDALAANDYAADRGNVELRGRDTPVRLFAVNI